MSQSSFISGLLTQTDVTLRSFVFDGYHALSNHLTPVVSTLVALMVVGYGWALLKGAVKTPIIEAANIALKLGVILTLAKNWFFFSGYLYEFFTNGPIQLTKVMIGAANLDWSLFASNQIDGALEDGFNQGMDAAMTIVRQKSFNNWGLCLLAFLQH